MHDDISHKSLLALQRLGAIAIGFSFRLFFVQFWQEGAGGLWARPCRQYHLQKCIEEVPAVLPFRLLGEQVHLFTDGSTSFPELPLASLASWASIEAKPECLEYWKVFGARLRGPIQSNNRAELTAVTAAIMSGGSGVIYTDSLLVFRGFQRVWHWGCCCFLQKS